MSIETNCDKCGTRLTVSSALKNSDVRCPQCDYVFRVESEDLQESVPDSRLPAGHQVADEEAAGTIRIVGEEESGDLNKRYRGGAAATNVLSFSYAEDPYAGRLLGDGIVCAPVVRREALEQNKSVEAHWAHMIVHGVLHLCGYTHEKDRDARKMERLETSILSGFGFPSPYC